MFVRCRRWYMTDCTFMNKTYWIWINKNCTVNLPSKPRLARRQIHRNNVEADSPPHYWKFALYIVFVDKRLILWKNWRTKWLSQNQPFTTQLLIPTNLHKMAADGHFSSKHACVWKPVALGNRTSQAHWRPHWMLWMLSWIQTSLSFWHFQWPLPLLKDLSAPWKESNISLSYHGRYQA